MPEINQLIPAEQLQTMPRRGRKKHETRWRIYTAAIELMSEHGYDAVKIEDICEKADVSNAAFFHHFSNKAALIDAYMDTMKQAIQNKLRETDEPSALKRLELINQEVARATKISAAFTPQVFGAFTSGEQKLNLAHLDTGITGIMTGVIKQGQQQGELNPALSPELIATTLCATWLVLPLATEDPSIPADPHKQFLELLLHGIAAN